MESKKQQISEMEFEIKLTSLQLMYSKHFDVWFPLAMKLSSLLFQLMVIKSQPEPRFHSGTENHASDALHYAVAHLKRNEIIEDKNGNRTIINNIDRHTDRNGRSRSNYQS